MDVAEAARVRLALLDADVAQHLAVVRGFVTEVRDRIIGSEVMRSVSPGQQVVKIVGDVMIEALGEAGAAVPINLNAAAPLPILLVGLQGSEQDRRRRKQTRAALHGSG